MEFRHWYPVAALTWGLLIISIVVVIVITGLVVTGVLARKSPARQPNAAGVEQAKGGLGWITWGVGVSSLALVGSLIWTMVVLAQVTPPRKTPLTIEVTGQQWWWKGRYLSDDPAKVITTADEFHIPVGQPVRVQLIGADVIHSFWVPQLTGKTDTIPGQANVTWLEADKPGRYRGQCTEYCGVQHAHMAFYIVADPPAVFQQWWAAQAQSAAEPMTPQAQQGKQLVIYKCGACHAIRGTDAGGTVAPDLTHLMSRQTLAAGALPNTAAALSGWIADPQAIKPGTNMPTLYLSGPELTDVRAYLETLR